MKFDKNLFESPSFFFTQFFFQIFLGRRGGNKIGNQCFEEGKLKVIVFEGTSLIHCSFRVDTLRMH